MELLKLTIIVLIISHVKCSSYTAQGKFSFGSSSNELPSISSRFWNGLNRLSIAEHTGFVDSYHFLTDYNLRRKPVTFKKAIYKLLENVHYGNLTVFPQVFTTYIDVKFRGDKTPKKFSIFQILLKGDDEELFVNTSIPDVIKNVFPLPSCLACKAITERLVRSLLMHNSKIFNGPLLSSIHHSLYCIIAEKCMLRLLEGKPEMNEFTDGDERSMEDKDTVYDRKHKALANVTDYYSVSLLPGDCVFVTDYWMHQFSYPENSAVIGIRWRSHSLTPSKEHCELDSDITLSDVKFTKGEISQKPPSSYFEKLHYFIKDYYLKKPETTKVLFKSRLLEDKKFGDHEKKPGFEERAQKIFRYLDINKDGRLDIQDFKELTEEELIRVTDKLNKDLNKLEGKDDLATFDKNNWEKRKSRVEEEELLELEKKFDKMLEDLKKMDFSNSESNLETLVHDDKQDREKVESENGDANPQPQFKNNGDNVNEILHKQINDEL